jgi:murein DD-endopeptidase MepM/ murein hydrolase activator NlpD
MLKLRASASSTVVAVLLSASSYGVRIDRFVHDLLTPSDVSQSAIAAGAASQGGRADYDLRLSPSDVALDAPLPDASTNQDSTTRVTVMVGDGKTLTGLLEGENVTAVDAQAAVEAARKVYDPRKLKTGQMVTVSFRPGITRNSTGFQGFEIQPDGGHVVTVERGAIGFSAGQTVLPIKTELHAIHGVIHNSLFESAQAVGIPYSITAALIRAFSYDVDFQREIQPDDRFKVMFTTQVGAAGSRPGDVLYAELILSGKSHAIYGVKRDDGTLDYFTRDGKSIKKGLLKTPVDGARLTSGFGMRMHPILGFTRMHKGVDFGVPTGTPIYAAGDGVIEFAGWAGGYGHFVKIRHNTRMETAYGHMSRIVATNGEHVHQGEVIGYVGMTGDATGPHLHYEVIKDGDQVNPLNVTVPVSTGLEGGELVAFQKVVAEREERYAALADNGVQLAAARGK